MSTIGTVVITDFPTLQAEQVCMLLAEIRTGIIVDWDGKRFPSRLYGGQLPFLVFESLEAARAYAMAFIAVKPDFECIIRRSRHESFEVHRNMDYIKSLPEKVPKRSWWRRFWG